MAFVDKPRVDENHRASILPNLELMRVDMMSLDPRLGLFTRSSNGAPSIHPFHPQIFCSELPIELSTSHSIEDSHFVLSSCLDVSHQGASIAHETTHDEYLCMHRFILMWHGPNMVSHMMPTLAHAFIDYEKYPWLEPSNGLYFS
jgi:hypothetical protein